MLDATLISGVIVPAFTLLAGNANWWAPAPLRRLHRRIGLAEHGPAIPAPPAGAGPPPPGRPEPGTTARSGRRSPNSGRAA